MSKSDCFDVFMAVVIAKPDLCELKSCDSFNGDCFVPRNDDNSIRNEGKTPNFKPKTPNAVFMVKIPPFLNI